MIGFLAKFPHLLQIDSDSLRLSSLEKLNLLAGILILPASNFWTFVAIFLVVVVFVALSPLCSLEIHLGFLGIFANSNFNFKT
jgi:hypothetical protein